MNKEVSQSCEYKPEKSHFCNFCILNWYSIIETAPPVVETGVADEARQLVLIDVKEEKKKLLNLGTRKLRQFCKKRRIQGYSTVYNRKKLDGLVDFLIAQQVTSAQVVECVEMLA